MFAIENILLKKRKNQTKQIYIFIILLSLWLLYFFFFNTYYQDAMELITEGAKKDIQLIELFYYRGEQTIVVLISYFILVSLHLLFTQYIRVRAFFEMNFMKLYRLVSLSLLVCLSLSLVNHFWILQMILIIISLTINFIIYTISKVKYSYIDRETIFEKKDILTREQAENLLSEYLSYKKVFFDKKNLILLGSVVEENNQTYTVKLFLEEKYEEIAE